MRRIYLHTPGTCRSRRPQVAGLAAVAVLLATITGVPCHAGEPAAVRRFHQQIEPVLSRYCFRCHNADTHKAGVVLDPGDSPSAVLANQTLWWKALKMVRAGLMPPQNRRRPNAAEIGRLETWIKRDVFKIDPTDPDPGRVILRRLNRVEYRNTIRALMGVDYATDTEFPPDDTGHGFDNIGEVLSLSPLLLEKYIAAARTIVGRAVPTTATVVAEQRIPGQRFPSGKKPGKGPLALSYYKAATVSHRFEAKHPGRYQLLVDLSANERFVDGVFDYNRCRLLFKVDGKTVLDHEYSRQGNKRFHYTVDQTWQAGPHELAFEVQPLTPGEKQVRSLTLRLQSVAVRGPLEKQFWVPPANYRRWFPRPVPTDATARHQYARELLQRFASRAYRRPVDDETVDRLVRLVEHKSAQPGGTFESGIAEAMTVVLASPRFLFREEGIAADSDTAHPLIDEYALASRLSYFLWSSMPDDALFRLAGAHQLRAHLDAQLKRMLADPRSAEFVRNFTGQWLQARDMANVEINARAVMLGDQRPDPSQRERFRRFRRLSRKPPAQLTDEEKRELAEMRKNFRASFRRFARFNLTYDIRRAMREETEDVFAYILHHDRGLQELLDSNYTFVNEKLANWYGIKGVKGQQMRLVQLPPDSPRGGILTQGTMLITTSNPDRTSPVKRGLFILDNILGTPPAPPPPNLPPLEKSAVKVNGRAPTLRETLARHRHEPLCSSCHNRLDPPGLAFEHFNALGRWRELDHGQPIDAAGELITGESFHGVRELKHILVSQHRTEFYRCLTEKMLTYALGRGLDYGDVETVDQIVDHLEKENGRPSALLHGIVASAPFQKCRRPQTTAASAVANPRGGTHAFARSAP